MTGFIRLRWDRVRTGLTSLETLKSMSGLLLLFFLGILDLWKSVVELESSLKELMLVDSSSFLNKDSESSE